MALAEASPGAFRPQSVEGQSRPETEGTGEAPGSPGARLRAARLPGQMARGTPIQLSVHNCDQQSAGGLCFKAPPPWDTWFYTALAVLWGSEHTLVALGPRLEKAQKQMEGLTAGDGTALLQKKLTIGSWGPVFPSTLGASGDSPLTVTEARGKT